MVKDLCIMLMVQNILANGLKAKNMDKEFK